MSTQQHERIPVLTLGWRLKMALGEMPVSDMADALGVSRATISRWTSGKGTPPKRAFVTQWAMLTNTDLGWLEHGSPAESSPDPDDGQSVPAVDRVSLLAASKRARGHYGHTSQYAAEYDAA